MAFLCQKGIRYHLSIKKWLKMAFLGLFLAIFLFPARIFAKQIFNLDICELNQVIENCYPDYITSTSQYWAGKIITTNDYFFSSPYSGKNDTTGNAGFGFIRENLCPNYIDEKRHKLTFKFRYPNFPENYIDIRVLFNTPYSPPHLLIRPQQSALSYTTTTIQFQTETSIIDTIIIYANIWYEVNLFSFIDNEQIRHYRLNIKNTDTNEIVFEKEYTTTNNYPIFSRFFNIVKQYHRFDDFIYYCEDDISETGEEIKPTGFYPIWNLAKPTSCQFPEPSIYNQVLDTSNFEVKGKLTIPIDNPYIWYKLRLKFWNYNTNEILYFNYDLPNLKAEDVFSFDYFVDISSILSTSTDLVAFSLRAYGKDNYGNVYEDLYPSDCIIYLGITETQPIFTPPEITFPEYPELEDCSQYNIPDRWICEIKNALKSIFLPSKEKLNELKSTLDLFKQKFPFNYINLFSGFYQDINNEINETSTIPFKILGQQGYVDLAFWENTAEIGGITQTFSHIIYNFFLFLFLLIFVFWLISFLKRIF